MLGFPRGASQRSAPCCRLCLVHCLPCCLHWLCFDGGLDPPPVLGRNIYWIFAGWLGGVLLVYLVFSLPMSYIKHYKLDYVHTEQMR